MGCCDSGFDQQGCRHAETLTLRRFPLTPKSFQRTSGSYTIYSLANLAECNNVSTPFQVFVYL